MTEKEIRMWFNPKLLETEALRKIIRSNRLEIKMAELLLDIMANMNVESVSLKLSAKNCIPDFTFISLSGLLCRTSVQTSSRTGT